MPPLLTAFLFLVALTALAANVVASARILRCPVSSKAQKAGQLGIVWLIPFLGAAVALLMTRERLEPGAGRYAAGKEVLEDVAVSKPDYEGAD